LKNLAFLYSGKPDKLVSLDADCNAISELLERHNEWDVVVNKPLKSEKNLREDFEQYKDEEIENLFIYYTGHAVSDGITAETLKVLLIDDEYDAQIFLNSLNVFTSLATRTVLVLDACYSSKFINNAKKNNRSIEIICSSLEYEKSSSRNDKSNLSYFTHNFCEAIEQLSLKAEDVNLKNIAQYINDKGGKLCQYNPPNIVDNTEMILTKDRSLYKLLEEFKSKFTSFKEMKDKVLEYVNAWDSTFKAFIETKTFFELFSWLLKNKGCLVCLFAEFNMNGGKYLEAYVKESDCEARKKKASNSQMITEVILKIRPFVNKSLTECKVIGWFKYNSNHYVPMKIENSIMDFSKNGNFKEKLPEELAKQLNGKNYSNLGLNLILHESLFQVDFQSLEIELEGELSPFMENFNITTQFEFRHSNYDKPISKISRWKSNSEKYENSQMSKIEKLIYPLYKQSTLFGKRFSNGDFVLLTSNYTLLDDKLSTILKHGIPNIMCPQSGSGDEVEGWKDVLVKDMKNIIGDFMDEAYDNEQNLHFIYDNYKNVETFQIAINNIADDTNYDDLKEG